VSFVEWNHFEDFGFYGDNLRIEASSFIVYLTKKTGKKGGDVHLNFMIVDPFYQNIQIAIFKSTKIFAKDPKNLKLEDCLVKTIMYCTKADPKDINFDVKMII